MTISEIRKKGGSIKQYDYILLIVISIIAFLCFPFLALYLIGINGSRNIKSAQATLVPFTVLACGFLALVASTKVVESDLEVYVESFYSAKDLIIGHFLAIHGKDPIYYAFVYLLSNSGFVNASGYVFTSVFVSYFLILGSTVRAARLLGICADKIFLAILILLYFDPLFSNSAHLLRQFLAGAVVLFALSRSTQDSKETWLLTIAASLIHSSATVFILVLLVRRFLGGRKLRNTILRLCCVIVALFMLRFAPGPITMVSSALGLDFISYAISRLSQESFFELQPLSAGSLVYVIILAAASFLSTFRLSAEKAHLSSPDRFTEPTLLISMTIIFSHFIGFDEISVRYLIYLYILSGVIMAIFLSRFCGPVMLVSMALSPCIPIIFILELNTGAWTYASGWQLAFGSFYSFIE